MKSLQLSNQYTGNVKVRELNDGGPPKPCSTHNERFTKLKFNIHSPENRLHRDTTQFGSTSAFLFKIVMMFLIVLQLIYTNSNSNWNCYKFASNLMLELTKSSSGSWSSTKSALFLLLCWMQNRWPSLTLIDSTSAQATSLDCCMFIHLWTLRIHSWSSVSLLAVLKLLNLGGNAGS